jgi:hypothetical protein
LLSQSGVSPDDRAAEAVVEAQARLSRERRVT